MFEVIYEDYVTRNVIILILGTEKLNSKEANKRLNSYQWHYLVGFYVVIKAFKYTMIIKQFIINNII